MKEYKELYLPLFYNWLEFTEELSDEEFGILIRALLLNARENAVPENLDAKIKIVYKFMLDSAKRAHESQKNLSQTRREAVNKRWNNECRNIQNDTNSYKTIQSDTINGNINENGNVNENENVNVNGNGNNYKRSRAKGQIKEQYGNFDTDYAFRKALERTYANLDDDDD